VEWRTNADEEAAACREKPGQVLRLAYNHQRASTSQDRKCGLAGYIDLTDLTSNMNCSSEANQNTLINCMGDEAYNVFFIVKKNVTAMYALADHCNFGQLHDEQIRDRIIVGLHNRRLSERMQQNANI